jgi:hypothetical protein
MLGAQLQEFQDRPQLLACIPPGPNKFCAYLLFTSTPAPEVRHQSGLHAVQVQQQRCIAGSALLHGQWPAACLQGTPDLPYFTSSTGYTLDVNDADLLRLLRTCIATGGVPSLAAGVGGTAGQYLRRIRELDPAHMTSQSAATGEPVRNTFFDLCCKVGRVAVLLWQCRTQQQQITPQARWSCVPRRDEHLGMALPRCCMWRARAVAGSSGCGTAPTRSRCQRGVL